MRVSVVDFRGVRSCSARTASRRSRPTAVDFLSYRVCHRHHRLTSRHGLRSSHTPISPIPIAEYPKPALSHKIHHASHPVTCYVPIPIPARATRKTTGMPWVVSPDTRCRAVWPLMLKRQSRHPVGLLIQLRCRWRRPYLERSGRRDVACGFWCLY